MKAVSANFKIPLTFLWVGFVSAISFMEAWLKFTAPGVTLTTGLAIGQVVFGALNKVELTIAFAMGVLFLAEKPKSLSKATLFILAVLILVSQTLYALPVLSSRIDIYLSGKTPVKSNIHIVYFLLEIMKVFALTIYGLNELKRLNKIET